MYLVFCIWVYRFVTSKDFLFKFIFADMGNQKHEWIRPADVFFGMYLCGCMPFIPFMGAAVIFFLCGIIWAMSAFFLGIVCTPLIIKIIWKVGINIMLIKARKYEAE